MKLKYIDSLRGIAILGVLMIHCSQYGHNENVSSKIQLVIGSGSAGVQLFFLISAFTLFLSFQNRHGVEEKLVRNFFIRRFFRIAPMYYLGIIYYLWQNGFGARYSLGDQTAISSANIFSNILFLHGFNPYWINSLVPGGWSIAVEMTFYFFVPFLVRIIKSTQQAFHFLIVTLLLRFCLLNLFEHFSFVSDENLWREYLFFYFPNQLPIFALGILLYFIIHDNYRFSLSPQILLVVMLLFVFQGFGFSFLPNEVVFFGIGFLLLAICLSRVEYKFFVNGFLQKIGEVSYSMYLVHFGILYWLEKWNLVDFISYSNKYKATINYSIRFSLLLILTFLVSSLTHRIIELPMQRLGKKIISK